jgi:HIRAN domain
LIDTLYVTWQDPETRSWYPVGMLSLEDGDYTFMYTRGVLASERFIPFGSMNNIETKYISKTLFPLFANRLLAKSRPEYDQYISWMGLPQKDMNPLEILARSGGERATDSLQIYACPTKTAEGKYETYFFCHGIRHMRGNIAHEVERLEPGQELFPMLDTLNPHDADAVALRTADPAMMIGYCPRYLAKDVSQLASLSKDKFNARIERVNRDAPIQYKLLCRLSADWPEGFVPCSGAEFQPVESARGQQREKIVDP